MNIDYDLIFNLIEEVKEASLDNKYIQSSCEILKNKIDVLQNDDLNESDFSIYKNRIINYNLRNLKNVLPKLDDSIISKLDEIENLLQ